MERQEATRTHRTLGSREHSQEGLMQPHTTCERTREGRSRQTKVIDLVHDRSVTLVPLEESDGCTSVLGAKLVSVESGTPHIAHGTPGYQLTG